MNEIITKINIGLQHFNAYNGCASHLRLSTDRYFDLTTADWEDLNLGEFTYQGLCLIIGESPAVPSRKVYISSNLAESTFVRAGITHCLPRENWCEGKGYFDDEFQVHFTRVYTLPLTDIGSRQRAIALRNYLKGYLHEELLERTRITPKKSPVTHTQHTSNQQINECRSCHQAIPQGERPAAQENGGLCHYCAHLYEKEGMMKP